MKIIKRAISLVMAVIMLFTGTPTLQASDLAFDRAQLAELQKEISLNVNTDINLTKNSIKELMDKYKQAKINNEERIKKLNEKSEADVETAKEYLEKLKEDVNEVVKTEAYAKIPREERKIVALSTSMYNKIREEEKKIFQTDDPIELTMYEFMTVAMMEILVGGTLWGLGALLGSLAEDASLLTASRIGKIVAAIGFGQMVVLLIFGLIEYAFVKPYKPILSPSMNANDTTKVFSEKPFVFLNQFENEYEYANLYQKCPELLKDTVDIEYYVSRDPNSQNLKDKLFTQTLYWYNKKPQERVTELHKFAERLRAEAKAGIKEQFNNSKIGLEER